MRNLFLIALILLSSCTQYEYFRKPSEKVFKGIATTYNITYDELDNEYILDYSTPVLSPNHYSAGYDAVVFNPIVVFKNNEFHFYFNFIHEFLSHMNYMDSDSAFMKDFTLYYRVNGVYKNIPLHYDGYNALSQSSTRYSSSFGSTSYAYKVFYSINNISSLNILEILASENIDDIRIRYGNTEVRITEESLLKFNEAVLFYINVILADYNINSTTRSTRDNGDNHSTIIDKHQNIINFLRL